MPAENKADRVARGRRPPQEAAQTAEWAHQIEAGREADRREIVTMLPRILQLLADKGYPWVQEIQVRETVPRRRLFGKATYDTHTYSTRAWEISSLDSYDPEMTFPDAVYLLSDGRLYSDSCGPKSPAEWLRTLPVESLSWFAPAEKLTGDRNLPRLLADIRTFRDLLEAQPGQTNRRHS